MPPKYTEELTVRFDPELFEHLKRIAETEDRSVASLIRQLARQHVARDT